MKKFIFICLCAILMACTTNLTAQSIIAWPMGTATYSTYTATDTTLTVKNTLTFLNYGALSGVHKLTLSAGSGLKIGSFLYIKGVSSGTEGVRLPALVPAAYDTILVTNNKTGTILLMWNGTQFDYVNKFEY